MLAVRFSIQNMYFSSKYVGNTCFYILSTSSTLCLILTTQSSIPSVLNIKHSISLLAWIMNIYIGLGSDSTTILSRPLNMGGSYRRK